MGHSRPLKRSRHSQDRENDCPDDLCRDIRYPYFRDMVMQLAALSGTGSRSQLPASTMGGAIIQQGTPQKMTARQCSPRRSSAVGQPAGCLRLPLCRSAGFPRPPGFAYSRGESPGSAARPPKFAAAGGNRLADCQTVDLLNSAIRKLVIQIISRCTVWLAFVGESCYNEASLSEGFLARPSPDKAREDTINEPTSRCLDQRQPAAHFMRTRYAHKQI